MAPLVQHAVDPCKKVLADAGVMPCDVSEAVLVGGMHVTYAARR
jgi:molecular chaperone DnaK